MDKNQAQKALLLLEDGTVFQGTPLGSRGKAMGTAAFNTSMVGFQEALTTPANQGLLLVQTFPLAGNYGINSLGWESEQVHAAGYIVRECCEAPSNYLCEGALEDFLQKHGVVGICGLDTRRLTRHLREKGEQRGMIVSQGPLDPEALLAELRAFVPPVPRQTLLAGATAPVGAELSFRVGAADFGMTNSVHAALSSRGIALALFGPGALSQLADQAEAGALDGILLSDGPEGAYPEALEPIRRLCGTGLPILGLSLGHQLLAHAMGMQVSRLKCGHRGANQPVRQLSTGRTYITTQNHACYVDKASVLAGTAEITFQNANDQTCEGLRYTGFPGISVQFLPDGEAHIHSTAFIYDQFAAAMRK